MDISAPKDMTFWKEASQCPKNKFEEIRAWDPGRFPHLRVISFLDGSSQTIPYTLSSQMTSRFSSDCGLDGQQVLLRTCASGTGQLAPLFIVCFSRTAYRSSSAARRTIACPGVFPVPVAIPHSSTFMRSDTREHDQRSRKWTGPPRTSQGGRQSQPSSSSTDAR